MSERRTQPNPSLPRRALRKVRHVALGALGRTRFGTITAVTTRERACAITFDGGPDERWTPRVLDVLEAHGAKGTFFVIGKYVDAHPDVMQRLVAAGHALGNHTYDHPSFPLATAAERRRELRACETALHPYPQSVRLFRPPYLDQDLGSRIDSFRLGYHVVACSLHASDWEDREGDDIARDLVDGAGPGDVIMLHDAVCDQRYRSREAMLAGLDAFLTRRGDLRFVTVPDLLALGTPRREIWLKRPNLARFASYERVI